VTAFKGCTRQLNNNETHTSCVANSMQTFSEDETNNMAAGLKVHPRQCIPSILDYMCHILSSDGVSLFLIATQQVWLQLQARMMPILRLVMCKGVKMHSKTCWWMHMKDIHGVAYRLAAGS